MKKVLLILISVLCVALYTNAQGTLQFNQVKLVSSETVPSGKVWKVVSVISTSDLSIAGGVDASSKSTQIAIDGITCYVVQNSSWIGSSSGSNANPRPYGYSSVAPTALPLWLPAGTTLAAGTNVSKVSVIEFNVIP